MMEYNADQLFNAIKAYNEGEKSAESSNILKISLTMLAVACIAAVLYFKKR
jgi:hypothetical protein